MKNLLMAIVSALAFFTLNGQMRVWDDGTIVYSRSINEVDSITFVDNTLADTSFYGDINKPENGVRGELSGVFSVSETKKIRFSCGNVQFQPSTGVWRFAPSQLDIVGSDNFFGHNGYCQYDSTYPGWLDLFNWNVDSIGNFVDWGQYFEDDWRTLSYDEWDYLINKRVNADSLIYFAGINKVDGYILLPDSSDIRFDYENLVVSLNFETWLDVEKKGAVFLPNCGSLSYDGYRYETGCCSPYWSSSSSEENRAYSTISDGSFFDIYWSYKFYGNAVRLVRTVE